MMKRWTGRIAALALAVLAVATVSGTAGPSRAQMIPVAMVTDMQGDGTFTAVGLEGPVGLLAELGAGSRVTLASGATMTLVYLASGEEYLFTGPATVDIGPEAATAVAGAAGEKRLVLASAVQIKPVGVSQASVAMRAVRDKPGELKLLHPVDTAVLDPHPLFRWQGMGAGIRYTFVIEDRQGRPLYKAETDQDFVLLPDHVTVAEDQSLTWKVMAQSKSKTVYKSAAFRVTSAAARARIETLRPGDGATFSQRLVFATVLDNMGLKADAKELFRTLAKERPENRTLRALAKR